MNLTKSRALAPGRIDARIEFSIKGESHRTVPIIAQPKIALLKAYQRGVAA